MWSVWLSVITLIIVYITTHWVYLWRNPKCSGSGKLPPGSMGFPLIGETIEFFTKTKSLDIPSFIKKRITKYGPLFKTSLVGRPVVISTDAETNLYILQQGDKIVEVWYMDSFEKLILQDTMMKNNNSTISMGYIHKYLRNLVLKHFGPESIKEKLLSFLEESISQRIHAWSKLPSLELKCATTAFAFDCTAKLLFGYEADKSGESVGDSFSNFIQGMMSVPLDIPGTTFHKCLKNQKKVVDMMRKEMQERKANPEIRKGDFLDHITQDMNKEKFLTEDFIVFTLFVILVASFESISSTLTVALMSLTEHPTLVQELMEEHEAILTSRGSADSGVTWDEYKSMTFTHHVISESLRLGNAGPGLMRRAVRDIPINGYTIPKGWAIMVVPSAIQLNPDNYEDPLVFNPWRWKHIRESVAAKGFMPFGGGSIMCPGAELSKVLMAMFLHKLVTKYRWTKIKGGEVARTPLLTFGDGFHIQVEKGCPWGERPPSSFPLVVMLNLFKNLAK